MKVAIAGGTGFIGEPLAERLIARGDEVIILTRNPAKVRAGKGVAWDPPAQGAWSGMVASCDTVINLAGENIGEGRWTPERKRKLLESRLQATAALVEAMRREPARSRTFVSASAIGYYGDRADEPLDERSPRGRGFLSDLTAQWEAAAREAEAVARVVILRFGIVLSTEGGALARMLLPFRLGAGGPVAGGGQWMSWIDREDVLRMIEWAVMTPEARGIYNATAPEPVRNRDFTKALGRALHRPALLPTPGFALRLAFGEMGEELLVRGQRVLPQRAQAEGFEFRWPELDEALRHAL